MYLGHYRSKGHKNSWPQNNHFQRKISMTLEEGWRHIPFYTSFEGLMSVDNFKTLTLEI